MPLVNAGEIPRGLSDLKASIVGALDVPGTSVDIPGVQALTWNVTSNSQDVQGDDATIAIARDAKGLDGSFRIAKINLEGLAQVNGGTATTTGTTPAQIKVLYEASAAPSRYLQLVGQSNSYDLSGSAYRVTLYKALVTGGPNETLEAGNWNTPELQFQGVATTATGAQAGALLKRELFETLVAVP